MTALVRGMLLPAIRAFEENGTAECSAARGPKRGTDLR